MKQVFDLSQFEYEIGLIIESEVNIFRKCTSAIELCNNILSEMRKEIALKGFINKNSEIKFFKEIKQLPLRKLIYYFEIMSIETSLPKVNYDLQRKYLLKRAGKFNAFFANHHNFVQYNELGHVYMDEQYYTRKFLVIPNYSWTYPFFQDLEFNTTHDRLLAQLNAFELVSEYIQKRLMNLKDIPNKTEKSQLRWTSSKVSLTELIYALHSARAINNGNISIKHIADVFQSLFNLEIGDYYRSFSEMKLRKKDRTKFLNELSIAMINNMESFEN